MKHVEMKTGNRELFNEFLQAVLDGLKRACSTLEEAEYRKVYNKVTHVMRAYLNNIFHIKTAEKAIKEMEISCRNNELKELKRTRQEALQ